MKIENTARRNLIFNNADIEFYKLFIDASNSTGVVVEFMNELYVIWMNLGVGISHPNRISYPIRYLGADEHITLTND